VTGAARGIPTAGSGLSRQPAPRAEWDIDALLFAAADLKEASMAREYSKASSAKKVPKEVPKRKRRS